MNSTNPTCTLVREIELTSFQQQDTTTSHNTTIGSLNGKNVELASSNSSSWRTTLDKLYKGVSEAPYATGRSFWKNADSLLKNFCQAPPSTEQKNQQIRTNFLKRAYDKFKGFLSGPCACFSFQKSKEKKIEHLQNKLKENYDDRQNCEDSYALVTDPTRNGVALTPTQRAGCLRQNKKDWDKATSNIAFYTNALKKEGIIATYNKTSKTCEYKQK